MVEFLRKLFGSRSNSSAQVAKRRLVSVLIIDTIPPDVLEKLRLEMIALLKKYMEIDESNIEIKLGRDGRATALTANVRVLGAKSRAASLSETFPPGENKATRAEPARSHNKNRRHK